MPRYPIERSTNFIIEKESWSVVEYDHTSVPGVIYLSLTENKINLIYDDLDQEIADTDKMAKYNLSTPEEVQTFKVGDIIDPAFTLTKNGIPINLEVDLLPTNKSIVKIINNKLIAIGAGNTEIIVQVRQFPQVQIALPIVINENEDETFSAYITGPSSVRLDRDGTYKLIGTTDLDNETVTYSIDNQLATIVKQTNNECVIHTNDLNQLGSFVLSAVYNGTAYTKTIQVIPLW